MIWKISVIRRFAQDSRKDFDFIVLFWWRNKGSSCPRIQSFYLLHNHYSKSYLILWVIWTHFTSSKTYYWRVLTLCEMQSGMPVTFSIPKLTDMRDLHLSSVCVRNCRMSLACPINRNTLMNPKPLNNGVLIYTTTIVSFTGIHTK